jgi:hypothetical protein
MIRDSCCRRRSAPGTRAISALNSNTLVLFASVWNVYAFRSVAF